MACFRQRGGEAVEGGISDPRIFDVTEGGIKINQLSGVDGGPRKC